ncbi:MAG: formylglycine-generating enzyme family protein [Opitutaceae bacterium]|nr:formylglycine-generating enzyme family protein [Opitutaceae bacterium]
MEPPHAMKADGTCCAPGRPGETAEPHAKCGAAAESAAGEFNRVTHGSVEGMRLLPGGEFLMGNDGEYGFADDGEGPVHAVSLRPFYIDETTVTNERFAEFVNATGYRTEAERFGWSFVFFGHLTAARQAEIPRQRVLGSEWWCRVDGATWRHPEGPGSNIKKRWAHPVVQVSWHDAAAYAAWAGKRLPTEAEWEYAARGGLARKRFPWGDELEPEGKHRMNVWQGNFPVKNTEADGHYGPAPAKSYRANGHGLYQMTGNVWEWCHDWFDAGYYRVSPTADPTGPGKGERRVMRGGSYLCHASYCNRYRTDARSSNTPDSATTNLGFRCVRDVV